MNHENLTVSYISISGVVDGVIEPRQISGRTPGKEYLGKMTIAGNEFGYRFGLRDSTLPDGISVLDIDYMFITNARGEPVSPHIPREVFDVFLQEAMLLTMIGHVSDSVPATPAIEAFLNSYV